MPKRISNPKPKKPFYLSKSYRRYLKRLNSKYPPWELWGEMLYTAANRIGFMRRLYGQPQPKIKTPVLDALHVDTVAYTCGHNYDHLLANESEEQRPWYETQSTRIKIKPSA